MTFLHSPSRTAWKVHQSASANQEAFTIRGNHQKSRGQRGRGRKRCWG